MFVVYWYYSDTIFGAHLKIVFEGQTPLSSSTVQFW